MAEVKPELTLRGALKFEPPLKFKYTEFCVLNVPELLIVAPLLITSPPEVKFAVKPLGFNTAPLVKINSLPGEKVMFERSDTFPVAPIYISLVAEIDPVPERVEVESNEKTGVETVPLFIMASPLNLIVLPEAPVAVSVPLFVRLP